MDIPDLWISPSAIKTRRMCDRKWAFRYISRIREPSGQKADFGTAVDDLVGRWLNTAKMPPANTAAGKVARAIITEGAMPDPSESPLVQWPIRHRIDSMFACPVVWNGFMDWGLKGDLVGDTKTTSAEQYALTEETMINDPQVQIYSAVARIKWGVPRVRARWTYAVIDWAKKDPVTGLQDFRKVKKTFTRSRLMADGDADCARGLEGIFDTCSDMARDWVKAIHELGSMPWRDAVHEFPATGMRTDGCDAFGGCKYARLCKRSSADYFGAHVKLSTK